MEDDGSRSLYGSPAGDLCKREANIQLVIGILKPRIESFVVGHDVEAKLQRGRIERICTSDLKR